MKDRSELFSCFDTFVNQIKTQYAAVLKILRSDNALEYKSFSFQHYFLENGIIHATSMLIPSTKWWFLKGYIDTCLK